MGGRGRREGTEDTGASQQPSAGPCVLGLGWLRSAARVSCLAGWRVSRTLAQAGPDEEGRGQTSLSLGFAVLLGDGPGGAITPRLEGTWALSVAGMPAVGAGTPAACPATCTRLGGRPPVWSVSLLVSRVAPLPPTLSRWATPAWWEFGRGWPGDQLCVLVPWGRLGGLWALGLTATITHLPVELCPPGGQHVLAEPGGAPAVAPAGGGVQDLHVRIAHHPVHAEAGRLAGLAGLSAADACRNKWEQRP